jgi:tetratricopeptide (TPR) repeat protein
MHYLFSILEVDGRSAGAYSHAMRFPVLLMILSMLLSGCFGFFETPVVRRGLTNEEIVTQQQEAEAAESLVQAVQLYHNGGYLDEQAVQELLDKAVELDPTLTDAWYQRAVLFLQQKKWNEAYSDLKEVIRLDPKHERAQHAYGFILFHRGAYRDSITAFDAALAGNNFMPHTWALRGAAYAQLGKNQEALRNLTEAIAYNPAHRDAYYNRGLVYARLGDYEAAIHDLTQALTLDANAVDTLKARALIYVKIKQYERAFADYNRAIVLNPNSSQIASLLAEAYGAAGKYGEAEGAAHRAMLLARDEGNDAASKQYADRADAFAAMGKTPPAP